MIRCLKCRIYKPITEFNKNKSKKDGYQSNCRKCDGEAATKSNRVKGHLPMAENKICPSYLGVAVAERLVRHLFTDVVRIPNNNPGFDFICNQGKRIDVKSACIYLDHKKYPRWQFHIRKNTTADYFLLLAFNNRADLEPIHQWLIPGEVLNHLSDTCISLSTIGKWDLYRQPIEKARSCCSAMKK